MSDRETILDAVAANDVAAARRLLEGRPALAEARDDKGVSALLLALYHRHDELAALLRGSRAQVDVFEAAALGETTTLENLLEAAPSGADGHAADGFTALHLACFFGRVEAANALVRRGADVNAIARNESRVQPIHSAVAGPAGDGRQQAIVELLLGADADADAVQHGGWTPLMAAAKQGSRSLVETLLAHGADPTRASDSGASARELAPPDVVDLLDAATQRQERHP